MSDSVIIPVQSSEMCTVCGGYSKVLDSRVIDSTRRRRRECLNCGSRWNTKEITYNFDRRLMDMRPLREEISEHSLVLMGVPKKFCNNTLDDFNTYDDKVLRKVKEFVADYIDNIESNIEFNKGIFFIGSNGVGKSMLSCIILKEAYRHRYSCRRVTFSNYIDAYTKSWGAEKTLREVIDSDLLDRYKGVEFLVLEEVGKEIDSKIAKPILEDLLRYREEHGLVTIICCNMTLEDFKKYYDNSICSIVMGTQTIIKIVGKDRRKEVFESDKSE